MKKMVGKKGVSALVFIIMAVVVVLLIVLLVVLFWPRAPAVPTVQVAVQGKVSAGGELPLQVTVTSQTMRDITLVAELFNANKQLVNIGRERMPAVTGEQIAVIRLKVPAALPPGRYTAVVTARYDKTKLLKQDTSVRILEAEAPPQQPPVQPPPVQPVVNKTVAPPIANKTEAPPVAPVQPSPEAPPREVVPELPPAIEMPDVTEIDNVGEVAKLDKQKALGFCDTLTGTDNTLCVSRVAVALQDGAACARLPSMFDQDKCYLSMASAGNADACTNVQDQALRSTCEAVSKFYTPAGAS